MNQAHVMKEAAQCSKEVKNFSKPQTLIQIVTAWKQHINNYYKASPILLTGS